MSEAERESQAAAEKARKAQLAAQTEIDDLLWLMSDKRGRRFVWRLLGESGIYRPSYLPGVTDAMATAYSEGQRNGGLNLLTRVTQHCPERFSEMQKEAQANARRTDRSTSSKPSA